MCHRDGYSRTQLALHWLVVLLVLFQFVFNESMSRAYETDVRTGELAPDEGAPFLMPSSASRSFWRWADVSGCGWRAGTTRRNRASQGR